MSGTRRGHRRSSTSARLVPSTLSTRAASRRTYAIASGALSTGQGRSASRRRAERHSATISSTSSSSAASTAGERPTPRMCRLPRPRTAAACGAAGPAPPASATASPRSTPCELAAPSHRGWGGAGSGGGRAPVGASRYGRRRPRWRGPRRAHRSSRRVGSPSDSASVDARHAASPSRSTTAGPTPSSRRYGLPTPITTMPRSCPAPPSGRGSGWRRRCTGRSCGSPARTRG